METGDPPIAADGSVADGLGDESLEFRAFLVGSLGTGVPPIAADGSVRAAGLGVAFARPPWVLDGAAPLERGSLGAFGFGAVFARSLALPDDAASWRAFEDFLPIFPFPPEMPRWPVIARG